MKFKDIKVGDTVFVQQNVYYGIQNVKSFFVPKKVTKVTTTQFEIETGEKFRKKDGKKIGDYRYSYKEGDKYWDEYVKDESKELLLFKEKVKIARMCNKLLSSMKVVEDSKLTKDDLSEIHDDLLEVSKKIKK